MAWDTRLAHRFDEQYFEYGRNTGYSWYENYSWMPDRSRMEVDAFVRVMRPPAGASVVDFGCAKGFFVRAMVEAEYDAYGIDISQYAIDHCDPVIRGRLSTPPGKRQRYDYGFVKDVLEHVAYQDIEQTLAFMASICPAWLIIVPMGGRGKYKIPEYEYDRTHIIREGARWWLGHVERYWHVATAAFRIAGLKDNWWPIHRTGNLFLVCDARVP